MARPKKSADTISHPSSLMDALKFVSSVSLDSGAPNQTHSIIGNNWILASNGTISAGHRIIENIQACPHTNRMIDALSKCASNHSITLLDSGRLSILSNKFRALVPCVERELLATPMPDPPCGVIDDRLKVALDMVGVLASENAQQLIQASILLQSGSVIATDSKIIFEAWHGIDLPQGLVLPKAAATAIVKKAKKLSQFGFSRTSFTFYFDDSSWIKSQLYSEAWPNVQRILDILSNPWPLPSDFWIGFDAVTPFSEDEQIRFKENMLLSHDTNNIGAQYNCVGIPAGPKFNIKRLKLIQPYAKTIDFMVKDKAMFFGDNLRGALAGTIQ